MPARKPTQQWCECIHHPGRRNICGDCTRPISPARSVEEALLDIALRAVCATVASHALDCICYACTARTVVARALVAERHATLTVHVPAARKRRARKGE